MAIREITPDLYPEYNEVVTHPVQSSAWAEFRRAQGTKVIQLGIFNKDNLVKAWQLTIHSLPGIPGFKGKTILYCPKGPLPDTEMIEATRQIAQKYQAIFVKFEPDIISSPYQGEVGWGHFDSNSNNYLEKTLTSLGLRPARSLFTPYNFLLDLTPTEEQLLINMKPKTRYNLKLAQKKGVKVYEDNSEKAFDAYIKLMAETTSRQNFLAHTADYHRKMWHHLHQAKIAHLFLAEYQSQIVTAWILFKWKDKLYYPYGASSREHREVMPNYLMMWEAILFGKHHRCTVFDLWGTAGHDPKPSDPWYGFHHFKEGFGPQLVKYLGSYDLIIDQLRYPIVLHLDTLRRGLLKARSQLFKSSGFSQNS